MNARGELFVLRDWSDGGQFPRLAGSNGSHKRVFSRFRQWSRLLVMSGLHIRELRLNKRDDWVMKVSPLLRLRPDSSAGGGKAAGLINQGKKNRRIGI